MLRRAGGGKTDIRPREKPPHHRGVPMKHGEAAALTLGGGWIPEVFLGYHLQDVDSNQMRGRKKVSTKNEA